jgi:hypothetical protein
VSREGTELSKRTLSRTFFNSQAEAEVTEIKEEILHGQLVKIKVYSPASAINPVSLNGPMKPSSRIQPLGGFGSSLIGSKIPPTRATGVDRKGQDELKKR